MAGSRPSRGVGTSMHTLGSIKYQSDKTADEASTGKDRPQADRRASNWIARKLTFVATRWTMSSGSGAIAQHELE
jgi:hypothetical protein